MQTPQLYKRKFVVKKSSYLLISGIFTILSNIAIAGILLYALARRNPTVYWGYLALPALFILIGALLVKTGRKKENVLWVDVDQNSLLLVKADGSRISYTPADMKSHSVSVKNNTRSSYILFQDGNRFDADNSYTHQTALLRLFEYLNAMERANKAAAPPAPKKLSPCEQNGHAWDGCVCRICAASDDSPSALHEWETKIIPVSRDGDREYMLYGDSAGKKASIGTSCKKCGRPHPSFDRKTAFLCSRCNSEGARNTDWTGTAFVYSFSCPSCRYYYKYERSDMY